MASLFASWPADRLSQFVMTESQFAESGVAGSTFVAGEVSDLRDEEARLWLASTGADLVYARAAEWPERWWELGQRIAEFLGVPFVYHIFDDTVGWCRVRFSEPTATLRAMRCDLAVERLVGQAAAVFSCSETHSRTLQASYGVNSQPFVRTLAPKLAPKSGGGSHRDSVLRLAYAGRCNPYQHRATFELVADAAKAMSEAGRPVIVDCIGPKRQDFEALIQDRPDLNGTVNFHGSLDSADAQFDFLNERDAILVTLNFDEGSRLFIGDSLASKLLDSTATDLPVIVIGPSHSESVAFARRTGVASVVDRNDPNEVTAILEQLRIDRETPESQLHARQRVRTDWSPDVVLERFELAIQAAAG